MVLKIDNLEINVKGLRDATALGDRPKHAYGRNGDTHGLRRNVPLMIVRFTIWHSTYVRSHSGNVNMEGVKYDRPAGWREK